MSALNKLLARWGEADTSEGDASAALWRDIRDVRPLAEPRDRVLWRVSTIASDAPKLAAAIARQAPDAKWYFDWGGGLVWLSLPATPDAGGAVVRSAVAEASGHATLIRAPDATRLKVPVFQPQAAAVAKLSEGIKRSFDPSGIFEPGRMYDGQ
jgi:glycolate oxidase FAD binding subunit